MKLLNVGLSLVLLLTPGASSLLAVEASLAIPGGVADGAGNVGYLTSPSGGVVAVNLEDGDVLWESKVVTRPLAVAGNRLAAFMPEKGKANVIRIALLDVNAKGRKVKVSEPITLPDWAKIGTGLDHNDQGASVFRPHSLGRRRLAREVERRHILLRRRCAVAGNPERTQ